MKKEIVILSLFVTFCIGSLCAQDAIFGLKGGVNYANITKIEASKAKLGLHFGGILRLPISDKIEFQPELVYSAQGYDQEIEGQDITVNIDYFNFPALVNYSFTRRIQAQIGPQLGVSTRRQVKFSDGDTVDIESEKVDISAVIGAQFLFDYNLFVQLRFVRGFTQVLSRDNRNSVFSASVGILFE